MPPGGKGKAMGYSREVYDAAMEILEKRRADARARAAALH